MIFLMEDWTCDSPHEKNDPYCFRRSENRPLIKDTEEGEETKEKKRDDHKEPPMHCKSASLRSVPKKITEERQSGLYFSLKDEHCPWTKERNALESNRQERDPSREDDMSSSEF
jgi:hypothetical protein